MSKPGDGPFNKAAKDANMTPRQYAEHLKKQFGTVYKAAAQTGFYPNTLYYHLRKKEQAS